MTVTTNTSDRPKLVWYAFERASKSGFLLQRIKIYRDNGGLLPDAHFHLVGKKKPANYIVHNRNKTIIWWKWQPMVTLDCRQT